MWNFVCFATDYIVAAVPQFWVHSNIYPWPKKSAHKFIERHANPNKLVFDYFKCTILHNMNMYR